MLPRLTLLPLLSLLLALALPVAAQEAQGEGLAGAAPLTVGMTGSIDQLALPGSELTVKPLESSDAVVLRIVSATPHGSAFRYDLEFYGVEPGTHDLRAFLRRRDGSSTAGLQPIPITIRAVLPPGHVEPHALKPGPLPSVGGYETFLWVGGVLWCLGLGALLGVGRLRARRGAKGGAAAPPTLADRLRPLVLAATSGALTPGQQAELERLLLRTWRDRLGLEGLSAGEAQAQLRKHDEAGALIRQLEAWLHQPPGRADSVDVQRLLAPYEDLPAEAVEAAQ